MNHLKFACTLIVACIVSSVLFFGTLYWILVHVYPQTTEYPFILVLFTSSACGTVLGTLMNYLAWSFPSLPIRESNDRMGCVIGMAFGVTYEAIKSTPVSIFLEWVGLIFFILFCGWIYCFEILILFGQWFRNSFAAKRVGNR